MTNKTLPEIKTLDQESRKYGLKRARIAQITNMEPRTLNKWFVERPRLIRVIIIGCFVLNELEKNSQRIEDFIKTLKDIKPKEKDNDQN